MMDILLKNADIITMDEKGTVYEKGCVGIDGTVIDYVGPYTASLDEKYKRTIDCRGNALMPGFVNAHSHAVMTMFRNYADDMKLMDWLYKKIFPLENRLDGEIAYWGASLAVLEMIKSGTTAFCDMYMFMDKVAEVCMSSGIRAALSRGLSGESGDDMDYRLKEALELYEKYDGECGGRIKVMLSPHAVYTCSPAYLKKVGIKSRELNIPIHVHLSETKDEVKGCMEKYNMSPVKLMDEAGLLKQDTVAAHCVVVDDEDIELLRKRGVNVVHNPGSNMKLASGTAPISRMLSSGINVCMGTDGAASNNNLDMVEEIRMAAYLQKVYNEDPTALPVDDVLRMATANGAAALGFDAGAIMKGKKADIIVLNTEKPYYYPKYNIKSAVVYSGNSSDVDTVIIDGCIVMEKGNVLTLDEERIFYEVQRCSERLTGKPNEKA